MVSSATSRSRKLAWIAATRAVPGGKVPVARTFEPVPGRRALYDELFAEFVRIYRASKAAHARLNRRA